MPLYNKLVKPLFLVLREGKVPSTLLKDLLNILNVNYRAEQIYNLLKKMPVTYGTLGHNSGPIIDTYNDLDIARHYFSPREGNLTKFYDADFGLTMYNFALPDTGYAYNPVGIKYSITSNGNIILTTPGTPLIYVGDASNMLALKYDVYEPSRLTGRNLGETLSLKYGVIPAPTFSGMHVPIISTTSYMFPGVYNEALKELSPVYSLSRFVLPRANLIVSSPKETTELAAQRLAALDLFNGNI